MKIDKYFHLYFHLYGRKDDVVLEEIYEKPERKRGAWTDNNACPFCGFQPWYERDIHTLSYCPHCGADMRGDNDDIPIEYFESGGKMRTDE